MSLSLPRSFLKPTGERIQRNLRFCFRCCRKAEKTRGEDTIMNRMEQWQYSKEQKEELHKMMAISMAKAEILAVFYPETDVAKMRQIRRIYRAVKHRSS